jgi:hypothetical protein
VKKYQEPIQRKGNAIGLIGLESAAKPNGKLMYGMAGWMPRTCEANGHHFGKPAPSAKLFWLEATQLHGAFDSVEMDFIGLMGFKWVVENILPNNIW